ncbi:DUF2235 domain-containing protein [Luteibacter flocculans]|uniref:DUF2235 domain-containing protein n=1 Tax=Luteibacter flocculans TaxID=2780091 RepID=A0ABY4T0Z7_9GAMM|nr:DUF2235 domain-containing protein [Luteibacter flocculans]URL58638.1 DUF2235 domain-containing protein [Luteibacter flocculans]
MAEKHRMGLDGLMQDGVKADLMTPMDEAWYDNARSELSNLRVPGLFAATNPHERLFFANFDGTGNDLYGDPEHPTNVGALHIQIEAVSGRNPRISSVYLPGPGTQKNPIARVWDGATGNTYDALLEEMYAELVAKAREWKKEDPHADIRIVTTGFSRGAEQAAGFSRMVHERGIQDIEGLTAKPARAAGSKELAWILPPLVLPGRTPISEVLFDPVGTGRPRDHDRTLPSSVVSGLQIVARDERRNSFPSTQIIPQGHSSDGRFLGVTVPGSHSDIGGSYHLDGLSILNFNLAADFINAHSDVPLVVKQGEPKDPRRYVIHHSEEHLPIYRTSRFDDDGLRDVMGAQVSPPNCRLVQVCALPEPLDPALQVRVGERHPVTIGPVPPSDPADIVAAMEASARASRDVETQTPEITTPERSTREPSPAPLLPGLEALNERPQVPLRLDPVDVDPVSPPAAHIEARPLRHGMQGADVAALQGQLAQLGFTDARARPLPADGVFGDFTQAAVEVFQVERGLPVDGIVGPETRTAIAEATLDQARSMTAQQRGIERSQPHAAVSNDRADWPAAWPEPTLFPSSPAASSPLPARQAPDPDAPPLAAGPRNTSDPRHPESSTHVLYNALREYIPDASDDRLLQFTAACHEHHITARNLSDIRLDEDALTISFRGDGWMALPVTVDLKQSPQPEEAIQKIEQFDQWKMQAHEVAQNAQLAQQGPLR